MTNSGFEVSNEAIAVIFGSGGFLLSMLTQYISRRRECHHRYADATRNDEQHKEFYRRIAEVERKQSVHESRFENLHEQLNRIEGMLEKLLTLND